MHNPFDKAPPKARPWTRENLFAEAGGAGEKAMHQLAKELQIPTKRHQIPREGWTCPACSETVQWIDEDRDDPREEGLAPCRCLREINESAGAAFLKDNWLRAAEGEWARNDIPPRYRRASFDGFQRRPGTEEGLGVCRQYAAEFTYGETVGGLYLFGLYGSGKTHLAVAAARAIVQRTLVRVVFKSTIGLMMEIKAGFGRRKDEDEKDPATVAAEAELLILDDLGQEVPTEFNQTTMAGIIWQRYDQNRPTIITSNQADAQLQERLGGGLVSRLYDYCAVAQFTASDFRKG